MQLPHWTEPSMQNLAGSALFLPQGGTHFQLVPLGSPPISRPCTFPPAHWWLILLINDFSLVIGGKLHSEYLGFSLLVANYSRNILFFLPWRPGCRHIPYVQLIFQMILYTMLLIICVRGVPNCDFCRIRIFCRIHFAESEYSAEHSALPNNEENMFNQASVQCRCSIKRVFNADVQSSEWLCTNSS